MAIFVSSVFDSVTENQNPSSNPVGVPAVVSGSAGTMAGAPQAPQSMAESVTRLLPIAEESTFRILSAGTDSLDLGVHTVSFNWEDQLSFFEKMKEAAQGTNGIQCKTELNREYLILPNGKAPQYRFHLQFLEYHIFIAKSECYPGTPNVFVSFNSCAIWHIGIDSLLDLLEFDLAFFGMEIMRIVPSRVDICVDFWLKNRLTKSFLDVHKVSLSRVISTHENCGNLETYYCSATKSKARVTIYDKGLEIYKSNKLWLLPLWGISDPTNVYRVEFRLKRPFLKEFGVNSMDDLREKLGSMWGHLTTEWFSLRLPDNPETDRRTILPLWSAIKEYGIERFGNDLGLRRDYSSNDMVSIGKILPHVFGRMITIAALSGIRDRKASIHQLCDLLYQFSDDNTFNERYREKCLKLGYRGKLGGSDDEC